MYDADRAGPTTVDLCGERSQVIRSVLRHAPWVGVADVLPQSKFCSQYVRQHFAK